MRQTRAAALEAAHLRPRHLAVRHRRASIILLMALGLGSATTSLAEDTSVTLLPQFQREALELKQRQSQASQGLDLDAVQRLDLYNLEMRQRRDQQWLQERQRLQREGLGRAETASDTRRLYQQKIFTRQRQQQMQRFGRELRQWRGQHRNPHR